MKYNIRYILRCIASSLVDVWFSREGVYIAVYLYLIRCVCVHLTSSYMLLCVCSSSSAVIFAYIFVNVCKYPGLYS